MSYTANEIIKKLLASGWVLDRIKGSHHIYKNEKLKKRFPYLCIEIKILENDYTTKYGNNAELIKKNPQTLYLRFL